MSDLNVDVQIRVIALEWAVRNYTDLEQPRNASGYNSGNIRRDVPDIEFVVKRAKAFEAFLKG